MLEAESAARPRELPPITAQEAAELFVSDAMAHNIGLPRQKLMDEVLAIKVGTYATIKGPGNKFLGVKRMAETVFILVDDYKEPKPM